MKYSGLRSEEVEVLLALFCILLLLLAVQPDDHETDCDHANSTDHHDQVQGSGGVDE